MSVDAVSLNKAQTTFIDRILSRRRRIGVADDPVIRTAFHSRPRLRHITNAFIPSAEEVCGLQINRSTDFDPQNYVALPLRFTVCCY